MIAFWVAASLLALAAAGLMLHKAARGGVLARADDPAVEVYRRALAEIDDLSERGLLPADERRAARAEVARRLLTAADLTPTPVEVDGRGVVPVAVAAAVTVASLALYLIIGSPGLADQPFASRLAAWRAHPENASPAALAAALGDIANQRPRDLEPLRKLAAFDLALGDIDGAAHAVRRALVIAPANADLSAMLGEVLVLKAQGAIGADARAMFQAALSADSGQPAARYYLARARIADGDTARGLDDWRALLVSLPPKDARRAALATDIDGVERSGQLPPPQPAAPPPGDISQAIQGMVDGLAARLRSSPNDPAGWVRLVRAYAVLGQTAKRDQSLGQARLRFGDRPDVLAALAAAGRAAPAPRTGQ
jgi:cytochrome c-type biogenesis protein CcmH